METKCTLQSDSKGEAPETCGPAGRAVSGMEGRMGVGGGEEQVRRENMSPGKSWQLAAAGKSFCQKMVI
jgi:hypothetical protein